VTAWHISDWLWQSNAKNRTLLKKRFGFTSKETKKGLRDGLSKFQRSVAGQNRALHVCRQIANGSKHMRLEKADPNIKAVATWDPVAEGVGVVKRGDLVMSLWISDGEDRRDAFWMPIRGPDRTPIDSQGRRLHPATADDSSRALAKNDGRGAGERQVVDLVGLDEVQFLIPPECASLDIRVGAG
jgi:hypothetical protein